MSELLLQLPNDPVLRFQHGLLPIQLAPHLMDLFVLQERDAGGLFCESNFGRRLIGRRFVPRHGAQQVDYIVYGRLLH